MYISAKHGMDSIFGAHLSFRGHSQPFDFDRRLLLPCKKASGHHQLCNLLKIGRYYYTTTTTTTTTVEDK